MSNRNILNQNINGRNILNIKNKNLLDGNAIKISDRNNINVDMKTNTTEQTNINDTDLFLLSDTTGETIKYITGSNLISGVSGNILAGTNLNKTGSTINLDTALTSMVSIDGGVNNLKLRRAGNDKITLETAKVKINTNTSTLGAALGLERGSGNQTNTADYELKQEYLASGFRTDKIDSGVRMQRFLANSNFTQLFCGHQEEEGQCVILNPNDDLHYIFKSGMLKIATPREVSHNFTMDLANGASTFTMSNLASANLDCDTFRCCKSRLFAIRSTNNLFLFNNATLPAVVGNNNNFLEQNGDGSLLKLRGTTIKLLSTTNEILTLDNTSINCIRKLNMNQNPMNVYSATDDNHQVKHSFGVNHGSTAMNGVLIRGFGGVDPFFRLQETDTSRTGVNVLDVYKDKIRCLKTLELDQNRLDFTTGGFQFMEFNTSSMDGILLSAFGNNGDPVFRVKTSNTNIASPTLLEISSTDSAVSNSTTGITRVFHKLAVIRSGAALQNDANDMFVVRNTGYVKALLHSDTGGCELAFRATVSGVARKASITYDPNNKFNMNFDSQAIYHLTRNNLRVYSVGPDVQGQTHYFAMGGGVNTSNGGNFIAENSQGLMYFQNDRNFVIYRSAPNSGAAFAANSNLNSSRDYKDNIIDLEENESINIIKNINPVSFTYKPTHWDKTDDCNNCGCKVRRGFIWEDVKPILPTACWMVKHTGVDDGSTKMLSKEEIIPDLVKTVQYLLNKIEKLESQINNNI